MSVTTNVMSKEARLELAVKEIVKGIIIIGEYLIAKSGEEKPACFGTVSPAMDPGGIVMPSLPVTGPVFNPNPEPVKDECVSKSKPKQAQEKLEETKPEPVKESEANPQFVVLPAELRKNCYKLICKALKVIKREDIIAVLGGFGAKTLDGVSEENLPKFYEDLKAAVDKAGA